MAERASSARCGEGVDADAVDHGDFLEFGDDGGDVLGEIGGELAQVAQDGGQAEAEEEGEREEYDGDEDDDRHGAGGMIAADAEVR